MIGRRVLLTDGSIGVIIGTGPDKYRLRMADGNEKWVAKKDIKEYK